jgi:hypothetical protein
MKKILFGCCVLLLGIAVWSFAGGASEQKPANGLTEQWFQYNGGDPYAPGSYTMLTEQPTCEGETQLCAVKAIKQSGANLPTIQSLEDRGDESDDFTIVVPNAVLRRTP